MGGEADTRAEPTLTISIEFYLSPSGKPGRKEKEYRQIRTLWSVIRGDTLGSKPQGALRRWRLGLCLLRTSLLKSHPSPGTSQGAGSGVPNSSQQRRMGKSWRAEFWVEDDKSPGPGAQPQLFFEMTVGPQACGSASLDLFALQITQAVFRRASKEVKNALKRLKTDIKDSLY